MKQQQIQFGRAVNKKKDSKLTNFTKSLESYLFYFTIFKKKIVSKMFWGRSSYYKNLTHIIILTLTSTIVVTGAIYKIKSSTASAQNKLSYNSNVVGQDDLLQQGGSIETVLISDPNSGYIKTTKHIVKQGETLESIANQYGVSKDTVRWASSDILSPFTDAVEVGWTLTIPSINGVLYTVKPGQTLDDIIAQTSINNDEANRFNIIEFNNLEEPYVLASGEKLFIPDGNLKNSLPDGSLDIPRGVFIDPLSHPDCVGYSYSRGYTWYHNAVDLARWPGCPIVSVANGIVTYAGWSSAGQGYWVQIDHGGGIKTQYFHGSGEFWVKVGDRVTQGQPIMMMGTTGNSTGVHLHFELWKNGSTVNPYGYVPYNM